MGDLMAEPPEMTNDETRLLERPMGKGGEMTKHVIRSAATDFIVLCKENEPQSFTLLPELCHSVIRASFVIFP